MFDRSCDYLVDTVTLPLHNGHRSLGQCIVSTDLAFKKEPLLTHQSETHSPLPPVANAFCFQGARAYTDRWVGIWFSDPYGYGISPGWFYLGIYALLGLVYGLFTFVRTIDFLFFCVRAAVNLHNGLLAHILKLPKSFFDTNPSGGWGLTRVPGTRGVEG